MSRTETLARIRHESILDLEEECRQAGEWRTIQFLETEIDKEFSDTVELDDETMELLGD